MGTVLGEASRIATLQIAEARVRVTLDVLRLCQDDGSFSLARDEKMVARIKELEPVHGSFGLAALAELGVPWPPCKGWRKALEHGEPIPLLDCQEPMKDAYDPKQLGPRNEQMVAKIKALESEPGFRWTRGNLAKLGVSYPPPKGWRKALEHGKTIFVDDVNLNQGRLF